MEFIRNIHRSKAYTFSAKALNTCSRRYCASNPVKKNQVLSSSACVPTSVINKNIINKIEQLSLINFDSDYSYSVLESAINFTEPLRIAEVNNKIEPMYGPSEKKFVPLRDDRVKNNASKKEILKNAAVLEEEYFVTPLNKIT